MWGCREVQVCGGVWMGVASMLGVYMGGASMWGCMKKC